MGRNRRTVAALSATTSGRRAACLALARDLDRYRALQHDIGSLETDLAGLLADTDGQVLSTLPSVAVVRAYQSGTLGRRGVISRQGLAEHRNALMGIAWGLSQHPPSLAESDRVRHDRY